MEGKLEILQLGEVLGEATLLAGQGRHQEAAAVLTPVLLCCDQREALMAQMDRATWFRATHTLLATAAHVKDDVLALRCHLRLLCAALPAAAPALLDILQGRLLCLPVRRLVVLLSQLIQLFPTVPWRQAPRASRMLQRRWRRPLRTPTAWWPAAPWAT